jgi:hypothetical protein
MADQDASFTISAKDQTSEAFRAVEKAMKDIGARAQSLRDDMHELAEAFAVHKIADFIGHAIEARARLDDLADVAGTTPEEFSKFEQPAIRAGLGLDAVASASAKLQRSLGEAKAGNTEKAALFRAMGIDPEAAHDSVEAMQQVAVALTGVTDKDIAAKVASDLLGKSYAELRPFMKEVTEAGHLKATTTNEEVEKAKALTREYADLKLQYDLQARVVGEHLVPTLTSIVKVMADTKDGMDLTTGAGELLTTMLKGAASIALAAVDIFYGVGTSIGSVAAIITAAVHRDWEGVKTIWKDAHADIEAHTEATNKKIDAIWAATADQVAKHAETVAKAGGHGGEAAKKVEADLKATLDFQKNYPTLIQNEQNAAQAVGAAAKLRMDLLQEQLKRGGVDQRQYIEQAAAIDKKRLEDENTILEKEVGLAVTKGDKLKKAELTAAIDRNTALIEAGKQLTASRLQTFDLLENQAFHQRIARDVTNIQLENLTERQRINQGFQERQLAIDAAERARLISATEAARQRELVETRHQAALGNVAAQGALARRRFDEMDMRMKVSTVFGALQEMTQGVANNNRQMFELNKIASTANAIINTAQGVTLALASYPPPISFAMAAAQLAAGLVQISTIQSAQFGSASSPPSVGGGNATPTFTAPTVATNAASAAAKDPLTIVHFHGANKDEEETARRFMSALNEASRNGAQFIGANG